MANVLVFHSRRTTQEQIRENHGRVIRDILEEAGLRSSLLPGQRLHGLLFSLTLNTPKKSSIPERRLQRAHHLHTMANVLVFHFRRTTQEQIRENHGRGIRDILEEAGLRSILLPGQERQDLLFNQALVIQSEKTHFFITSWIPHNQSPNKQAQNHRVRNQRSHKASTHGLLVAMSPWQQILPPTPGSLSGEMVSPNTYLLLRQRSP
jgi:hypothetical protein